MKKTLTAILAVAALFTALGLAQATRPSTSSAAIGTLTARADVPAFPGAQNRRGWLESRASFQIRACSRPPPPTTRTFIGPVA